jgi:hypothetical protein
MTTIVKALVILSAVVVSTANASANELWNFYEKTTAASPWKHLGEHPFDIYRAEENAIDLIGSRCTAYRFEDKFALKAVGPDGKTFEIDCMELRRDRWPQDFDSSGKRIVNGWQ